MRIAIVIPVYNNIATLPRTLESILNLNRLKDIELIIADDFSNDGTQTFLDQWFQEYGSRFGDCRIILNQSNLGISGNHECAFNAVKSDYGFYLGGDDIIYNRHLIDELNSELGKNPNIRIAKIDVEAYYLPGRRKERLYSWKRGFFKSSSRDQFAALVLLGNFLYAGPGTVLHIPTLKQIGGFDARFKTYEDLPLFYNFLVRGYPIKFLDVRGLYWVRSSASLSMVGFLGRRDQYEMENLLRREIVHAYLSLLSRREQILFLRNYDSRKAKSLVMISYYPWLRFRLVPSVIKKVVKFLNTNTLVSKDIKCD